jgi:hypothetical protein
VPSVLLRASSASARTATTLSSVLLRASSAPTVFDAAVVANSTTATTFTTALSPQTKYQNQKTPYAAQKAYSKTVKCRRICVNHGTCGNSNNVPARLEKSNHTSGNSVLIVI